MMRNQQPAAERKMVGTNAAAKGDMALFKSTLARSLRLAIATAALAGGTVTYAALPTQPDAAVLALGKLGARDLEATSQRGKALLGQLFPGQTEPCPAPNGPTPAFDGLCSWSTDRAEDDFDLFIGMKGRSIASVLTSWPEHLPKAVWACEAYYPDIPDEKLAICSVRSAPAAMRAQWAAGWRAYLDAAG